MLETKYFLNNNIVKKYKVYFRFYKLCNNKTHISAIIKIYTDKNYRTTIIYLSNFVYYDKKKFSKNIYRLEIAIIYLDITVNI